MKCAITIWENRISPVFDSARRLLVVELEQGKIVARSEIAVADSPFATVAELQRQGLGLLLCGALCERGLKLLEESGIELIPFLSGEVDDVLAGLAKGEELAAFALPGCRHCCCRRRGRACDGAGTRLCLGSSCRQS